MTLTKPWQSLKPSSLQVLSSKHSERYSITIQKVVPSDNSYSGANYE